MPANRAAAAAGAGAAAAAVNLRHGAYSASRLEHNQIQDCTDLIGVLFSPGLVQFRNIIERSNDPETNKSATQTD